MHTSVQKYTIYVCTNKIRQNIESTLHTRQKPSQDTDGYGNSKRKPQNTTLEAEN